MSHRGRRSLPDRCDPNLIPLLDVVLQLITFFMMLVHFGVRIEGATEAVRLPTAPAALPTADLGMDRLSVALDARSRLLVDDKAFEPTAAASWWEDAARTRREALRSLGQTPEAELPTVVVIRADRAAPFGAVRRMLEAAQRQGFARFTLLVLQEDAP